MLKKILLIGLALGLLRIASSEAIQPPTAMPPPAPAGATAANPATTTAPASLADLPGLTAFFDEIGGILCSRLSDSAAASRQSKSMHTHSTEDLEPIPSWT